MTSNSDAFDNLSDPQYGEVGGAGGDDGAKAPVDDKPKGAGPQEGGRRRRRRTRRKSRKRKRSKKSRKVKKSRKTKKRRGKRGLNPFFKLMLAAKKKGAASFKYKGRTYKGRKHKRLGMIYKKA